MFVIPIEDSLVYVEPIYLEATSGSLPEVKRVIIYYNDRIAYEETLADALDVMFGTGAGAGLNGDIEEPEQPVGDEDEVVDTIEDLIRKAVESYNKAIEAQQKGDWASYGRYLNDLDFYLNELVRGRGEETLPAPVDLDPDIIEE